MLYFLLEELATRPDLVRELREELSQNLDAAGHLPLSYLAELRKMDSFMLESARVTGSSHCMLISLPTCLDPFIPVADILVCSDTFPKSTEATAALSRAGAHPGNTDMR